jgi:glycerate-2-kinase
LRILNTSALLSTGNVQGREALLAILEAGLEASDPYENTRKLIRLSDGKLTVGNRDFEPSGTPISGDEVYDLSKIRGIYVFGACKGVQRVAKAIEDTLGERLTGGHVIDKKGHPVILQRMGVTLGSHPAPDDDCVRGCERIMEMTRQLGEDDLVFTIAGNGISSLLTMPVPGVSVEDVRRTTYLMQIERGVPTLDLNAIRNHLDMMKGGKISRYIHPAKMVHIIAYEPFSYEHLMYHDPWLHTLPDSTTFDMAIDNLKKWDAWDAVPASVRRHLEAADPEYETVKAEEFERTSSRIFCVMPGRGLPEAMAKAQQLGFKPVIVAERLMDLEARQVGMFIAEIARTVEGLGQPVAPPCALFTGGEVVTTVGAETGIGGRQQELALSAARRIAGSDRIVIGSVDTDGTDGPGTQFIEGFEGIPCLAGGIVDGGTFESAKKAGIDIIEELKRHNTTPPMIKLHSGIVTTPNISVGNITVTLVME